MPSVATIMAPTAIAPPFLHFHVFLPFAFPASLLQHTKAMRSNYKGVAPLDKRKRRLRRRSPSNRRFFSSRERASAPCASATLKCSGAARTAASPPKCRPSAGYSKCSAAVCS